MGPKLSVGAVAAGVRALVRCDALRARRIGRELRERVVLRVSAVNECPVCSSVHERVAARLGLDHEEVRRAQEASEGLDVRTAIALRWAEGRTLARRDEHLDARFEATFDREERREIAAIVDLFTFANRFNNTWEGLLPGAAARRRRFQGLRSASGR